MNPRALDQLRRLYLEKLYELSEGGLHPEVDYSQVQSALGYSREETRSVVEYLESKGLVSFKCRIPCIRITTRGIDEVERAMKANFAENERRVLQRLYDERDRRYTNPHEPEELARELNIDIREIYDIITELEEQDLIGGTDQASWIIPAGIKFIESGGQPTGAAPNVSFTTNIHGPNYGGIQQGTQGSTQNITLTNTNNPDFDRAITSLIELIRSASISDDDKEELQGEIQAVNKLALKEKSPATLERAKLKLDYIKTRLTATDIALKAAPYFPVLYKFFESFIQ